MGKRSGSIGGRGGGVVVVFSLLHVNIALITERFANPCILLEQSFQSCIAYFVSYFTNRYTYKQVKKYI